MKLDFVRTDKMHGDTSKSLLQAIRNGDTDLARRIIKARNFTNIDRQSSRKDGTALFWACCLGYSDVVHLLLLNRADVNAATAWGATPLHGCVDRNYVDIVTLLVRFGANVNQQTHHGDTPCHLASYRGFIQCVKRLTDEGADVDLRNNKGLTPLEEAYVQGHYDIYKYLVAIQQIVRSCNSTTSSLDSIQCLKLQATTTAVKAVKDTTSLKVKDVTCDSLRTIPAEHTQQKVVPSHQATSFASLPVQTDTCSVRSEIDGDYNDDKLSSISHQSSICSGDSLWNSSEIKESNIPVSDTVLGVLRLRQRAAVYRSDSSSSSSSDGSCSSLNDLSAAPSTFSSTGRRASVQKLSFKNI